MCNKTIIEKMNEIIDNCTVYYTETTIRTWPWTGYTRFFPEWLKEWDTVYAPYINKILHVWPYFWSDDSLWWWLNYIISYDPKIVNEILKTDTHKAVFYRLLTKKCLDVKSQREIKSRTQICTKCGENFLSCWPWLCISCDKKETQVRMDRFQDNKIKELKDKNDGNVYTCCWYCGKEFKKMSIVRKYCDNKCKRMDIWRVIVQNVKKWSYMITETKTKVWYVRPITIPRPNKKQLKEWWSIK